MRIFAFVSQKEYRQQKMQNFFSKYLKTYWTSSFLKISFLFLSLFFVVFVYLYNVNIASTSWYFLRQANREYESVVFKYEILKSQYLDKKQENWEQLYDKKYWGKVVDIITEVVYIPDWADLAMR